MGLLAGDVDYQERFSRAFRQRRLHPTTEMRVWEYVVGKPVDRVQVAADVTLHRQLEQERALFAQLGPEELRELLDDNQRLLDKARAMISGHFVSAAGATGPDVPATPGEIGTLPGDTCTDGDDA